MADVLAPLAALVGALATAIGGPVVTSRIQNRGEARLRQAISDNSDLAKRYREGNDGVADLIPELEDHVRAQVRALMKRERADLEKERDWSSFGVVIVLLALFGWIPIVLWQIDQGWVHVMAWIIAGVILLLAVIGTYATFFPSKKDPKKDEGELAATSQT